MVKVNGKEQKYMPDMPIAALLEAMGFSATRVAVECNGKIVPRKQLAERIVEDGDVLEVVNFVGGG